MAEIGYSDLNILYTSEEDSYALLSEAANCGYSQIALTYKGSTDDFVIPKGSKKEKTKAENPENPIKLPPKFLDLKTQRGSPLHIFRRLSVSAQDPKIFHDLANNPICKTYDIISVTPFDEKSMQQALDDINVDIIELDLSRRKPVCIKRSHARQAESNGKYFEVSYDSALDSTDSRTTFFANCHRLVVDMCPGNRGKLPDVIVLSSGAHKVEHLKSPTEAHSLCYLFGFPEKWSIKMNTDVAWFALNNSLAKRRTAKNAVQLLL